MKKQDDSFSSNFSLEDDKSQDSSEMIKWKRAVTVYKLIEKIILNIVEYIYNHLILQRITDFIIQKDKKSNIKLMKHCVFFDSTEELHFYPPLETAKFIREHLIRNVIHKVVQTKCWLVWKIFRGISRQVHANKIESLQRAINNAKNLNF